MGIVFPKGVIQLRKEILFIVFLIAVISGITTPVSAYYREYLGEETKIVWVPVLTVYDPPGDGSYTKVTYEKTRTTGIDYGGNVPGYYVDGYSQETWTILRTYETSHNIRQHNVYAIECEQKWDVWSTITWTGIYYEAELVESTILPEHWGWFTFSELSQYDMWVNSRMGTQGEYSYHRHVGADSPASDTYRYEWHNYQNFGLGFEIELKEIPFSVGVTIIQEDTESLELTYNYYDSTHSLDFYLLSDEPIQSGTIDGTTIWFDQ